MVAIILFALGMCGVEMFWRQRGHRPSIVDDPAWWSHHRTAASNDEPRTLALLGASKMQLGFSLETFQSRFPRWDVVQLAVNGRWPVATLRDLAEDERFVGTAVVSCHESYLGQSRWDSQKEYVDFFHNVYSVSADRRLNRSASTFVHGRLVAVNPGVRLQRILPRLLRGEGLPPPSYIVTHYDRSRSADYTLTDRDERNRRRIREKLQTVKNGGDVRKLPEQEKWHQGLAVIEQTVRRIQGRGGTVVFVQFPITGESWSLQDMTWPREIYWNQLGKYTNAVTVPFQDVPALADFNCPDTCHLDQRDKARFTDALLDELVRGGVFE